MSSDCSPAVLFEACCSHSRDQCRPRLVGGSSDRWSVCAGSRGLTGSLTVFRRKLPLAFCCVTRDLQYETCFSNSIASILGSPSFYSHDGTHATLVKTCNLFDPDKIMVVTKAQCTCILVDKHSEAFASILQCKLANPSCKTQLQYINNKMSYYILSINLNDESSILLIVKWTKPNRTQTTNDLI